MYANEPSDNKCALFFLPSQFFFQNGGTFYGKRSLFIFGFLSLSTSLLDLKKCH